MSNFGYWESFYLVENWWQRWNTNGENQRPKKDDPIPKCGFKSYYLRFSMGFDLTLDQVFLFYPHIDFEKFDASKNALEITQEQGIALVTNDCSRIFH